MAMTGAPSLRASISPLKRCTTPGPAVPHTATGMTGQIGFRDSGKNAVLFMTDVDELDLSVASEPVDYRIESVTNDAVTAFDSGVRKHLPQEVRHFS